MALTSLTRRQLLATCVAGLPALGSEVAAGASAERRTRLGIASYSYHVRLSAERAAKQPGLADPLNFLEHCQRLGAGGIQVSLGVRDAAYTTKLRKQADAWGMFLEGAARLPPDRAAVEQFSNEVRTARAAGVTVLRTVLLSGRRYETFDTAAAFHQWAERAWQSLTLAEPVLAQHAMRLAVENHKDYRAADLVDLFKRLGSKHVGACVDTGNNLALLEDPQETVATLAPWAYSVHLKDMAVTESEDGFLLSEVPLGDGFLDLKKIVATVRKARPEVQFNLEMMSRDPLKIPCLTPKYWATFDNLSGRHLAQTLMMVRKHQSPKPLPRLSGLSQEQQMAAEEANVRKCLRYAAETLLL